jgi:hypothetical protein
MLYDPQNFLHSMCVFAAARAGTALNPAVDVNYMMFGSAGPWNLFLNSADESSSPDPYAVVHIYGGAHERNNPKPTIAVQLAVFGSSDFTTGTLANALYRSFCLTNQEQELRMRSIPGFKVADNSGDGSWMLVNAVVHTPPSNLGRDTRGRLKIVSNFDLGFFKAD